MTAVFPASLRGPLGGSLKPTFNDGIVQDSGEIGPPRKRRRTTRVLRQWSFTLRLTTLAEKAVWDEFYETTTNFGIDSFTWVLIGTTYTVQLLAAPELSHVEADIYDVSISLGEI